MKGMCCATAAILALVALTSAFVVVSTTTSDGDGAELRAHSLAAGDPVAVITPLPDYVSNGSWYDLDGTGSYDTDGGFVTDWYWEVDFGGVVTTSHAQLQTYLFKDLGLYKINLTVTDNSSKTSKTFTAVVSILDKDQDQMPDWWELKYFDGSLSETGEDDYDNDGYTNLEEYAKGTDPTAKDPQPGLIQQMKKNWYVFVIAAAVIVGAVLAAWPFLRRRRKVREKKQIEAAIAIEKALEEEMK